ncbi:dihydrofolate reductase family protein [Flaviaesturariibacter amylovorans]|uniref:Dihydrofolate reductase family protein n=1 Tax=Flaviaesturariibacter amylovorans TaxID=1084520 RepID=A0ABP8HUD0_9BACT
MRSIILNLAVSLDGYIEGPKGEYDWCLTDQDYGLNELLARVDSWLMGRKTYELMCTMPDNGGLPRMKEYVFSRTLTEVRDGATLLRGDTATEVARIRSEPGKDLWLFGGAALTASLLKLGLVDELQLAVHPILLGGGTPLFRGIKERLHLELTGTQAYDTGLVVLRYRVKKSALVE